MAKQQTQTHPVLNPKEAMQFIEVMTIELQSLGHSPIPVMLWGQPGVGKSSIIMALGRKHNRSVIDVRLLLKDPTDIAGLPYFDANEGKLKVSTPVDFPDITDPAHKHLLNAFIIFDELSAAPKAVQSAALQLILDRRIGQYTLPEDVIMIAAGNRAEDGNVFEQMPTPLRNRFAHVDIESDFEQWKKWAMYEGGIHPVVISFLESNQGEFNTFDPKTCMNRYAFATPRSWERVSDALWGSTDRDTMNIKGSVSTTLAKVGSLVGLDVASKFNSYLQTFAQMPSPIEILDGKVKQFDFSKMGKNAQSGRYGLVLGLTHVVRERYKAVAGDKKKEQAFSDKEVTNFAEFLRSSMSDAEEFMAIAAGNLLTAKVQVVLYNPVFEELVDDISGLLNQI